jgi:hypothetical protein
MRMTKRVPRQWGTGGDLGRSSGAPAAPGRLAGADRPGHGTADDPAPDRSSDPTAVTGAVDRGQQSADDAGTAVAAAAHPADRPESGSTAGSAHHAVHGRPPHGTLALTTEAAGGAKSGKLMEPVPSVGWVCFCLERAREDAGGEWSLKESDRLARTTMPDQLPVLIVGAVV